MSTVSSRRAATRIAALAAVTLAAALPGRAQFLVDDDFDWLSPTWTVQRGYATVADGWVRLQGSYGIGRDAFIMAGVGSDWSDYRFLTRFFSEGGGDGWYNALINFRVQSFYGWSAGTYYSFYLYPPNSAIPPSGGFFLVKSTPAGYQHLTPTYYNPASLAVGDNAVEIRAVGGDFDLTLNGVLAASYHDPDPILTGGVALGAIWESATRYDYARVIEPYRLAPTFDTTQPRRVGGIVPIRFQIVDRFGTNRSAATTRVVARAVRDADTGTLYPVASPGRSQGENLCTYDDGAYRFNLATAGLPAGNLRLVLSVGGDTQTQEVPFTLR